MKTSKAVYWIIVVVVIVVAWYLYARTTAPEPTTPSANVGLNGSPNQTNTGQQNVPAILQVSHDTSFGDYLVASNGMTLYTYSKDTDVSNCVDACAVTWPPYTYSANEPIVVSPGVDATQISTLGRADGSLQLTYRDQPLYFYSNDQKPGDTQGQNVGGTWFMVKP